jgi:hypothetical protein
LRITTGCEQPLDDLTCVNATGLDSEKKADLTPDPGQRKGQADDFSRRFKWGEWGAVGR